MTDESKKIPAIGAKTVNKMNKKIKFGADFKKWRKSSHTERFKKIFRYSRDYRMFS